MDVVARLALVVLLLAAALVCGYCLARLRAPASPVGHPMPSMPPAPAPMQPPPAGVGGPVGGPASTGGPMPAPKGPPIPGKPQSPGGMQAQATTTSTRLPPRPPAPRPRPTTPQDRPLPPASSGNEESLVLGLIGAYDVSSDEAVQAHVVQVLQRNGFDKVIVPTGVIFDPASYEAVSTEPTSDAGKVKRVAHTVRPGWKGPSGLVRSAQVAVWVAEQGSDEDGTV